MASQRKRAGDASATNTQSIERDYVDSLMESWRRDRSRDDVELMGLSTRVARLSSYQEQLTTQHARQVGLSRIGIYILGALRSAGSPYQLAAGEIGSHMLSNSKNISVPLRQLEERGFIRRDFRPDDRRSVIVSLTEEGFAAYDEARTGHREVFTGLSQDEQATLSALLRKALIGLADTPDGLRESWMMEAALRASPSQNGSPD